jgi:hypothetical protein
MPPTKLSLGPDLSILLEEDGRITNLGDVFSSPHVAELTEAHFTEAAAKYPELAPAIRDFLAVRIEFAPSQPNPSPKKK